MGLHSPEDLYALATLFGVKCNSLGIKWKIVNLILNKILRCELGLGHLNNKALNFGRGAESAKAGAK